MFPAQPFRIFTIFHDVWWLTILADPPSLSELGVVRSAGLGRCEVERQIAAGTWRRASPGVVVCTDVSLDPYGAWLREATLLSLRCPGGVLSGPTAAALWGLDGFDPPVPLQVNVCQGGPRGIAEARRVRNVGEPCERAGLPVADIVTTLFDLGAAPRVRTRRTRKLRSIDQNDLIELAVESAFRAGLIDDATLRNVVRAAPRQGPGRPLLTEVLARRPVGAPPTESYLETRGLQLMRSAGLPEPLRQVEITDSNGRFIARVDFLIGDVVVEFDGREHHDRSTSFGRDRTRWTALQSLGWRPLVFTFDDVERIPEATVTRLRQTLQL